MPTLTPTHAAMASTTGWMQAPDDAPADVSSACFCCEQLAGEYKPLLEGSDRPKRLWFCRPCETTWVD